MTRRLDDDQSRALYELSAIVFNLLRSSVTPLTFSDHPPAPPSRRSSHPPHISPTGFASLLLGISLALMLCGSVTFLIGFVMMPWVIGFVMFLYVAGIVSTLSILGRSILYYATPTPRKDIPGKATNWKTVTFLLKKELFGIWRLCLTFFPINRKLPNFVSNELLLLLF